jgi:endogenous inhibitor of DNA gyrase (YacG/DUF329 family)
MAEMYCPNCGHHLVDYRTDRQPSGKQEVVLHWAICTHCSHVGLQRWSFANGIIPAASDSARKVAEETPEYNKPIRHLL